MKIASILVTISKLVAASTTMLLNAYLARRLHVVDFGIFSVYLAYINFLGLTLICGLNVSHIYHYRIGENFFSSIIRMYGVVALVAYTLAFATNFVYLYILSAAISIAALSIVNADAQARERNGLYAVQVLCQSIFIALTLVALVALSNNNTANFAIKTYSILALVFLIVLLGIKNIYSTPGIFKKIDRAFFVYGVKNFFLNLFGQLLYSADIFILAYLSSKQDVALYSVSALIAKALWLVTDAIGLVVFPKLIGKSGKDQIILARSAIGFSVVVCLFPSAIFATFGQTILSFVFGPVYAESFTSACILILASFPLILYKIGSRVAAASQMWRDVYISLTLAVVINIILCFLLIPNLGIGGAALASLIAYSICGVYLTHTLHIFGLPKSTME